MASPEAPTAASSGRCATTSTTCTGCSNGVDKSIITISATQRRHGNRLEEIQQSLDLQSGRLDRIEDIQRQQSDRLGRVEATSRSRASGSAASRGASDEILTLLRGRSG